MDTTQLLKGVLDVAVLAVLRQVFRKRRGNDAVYLTIS
jgi:hypothetical protein